MAVFKKHSRFAFAEQLGTQAALIDLRRYVDCRIFQIQFVSAIQHDIIIGYVLFPDVVQAVDGVDALAQNTVFDRLHIVRIHTLTNVVQPPEKFACEGVQIYGAVDFYDVRALIAVDKFQGVGKIIDVDVLLHGVFNTEVLLSDLDDPAERAARVFNKTVIPDAFERNERVHTLLCQFCSSRIFLFGE